MKKLRYAPTRFPSPFTFTWLACLTMDIYNAPGWLWGVVLTLVAILWSIAIYARCNDEEVDISQLPAKKKKEEN